MYTNETYSIGLNPPPSHNQDRHKTTDFVYKIMVSIKYFVLVITSYKQHDLFQKPFEGSHNDTFRPNNDSCIFVPFQISNPERLVNGLILPELV